MPASCRSARRRRRRRRLPGSACNSDPRLRRGEGGSGRAASTWAREEQVAGEPSRGLARELSKDRTSCRTARRLLPPTAPLREAEERWGRKGEGEELGVGGGASGAQRRSEARVGAPGEAGAGPVRTGGAGMEPEGPRPAAAAGAWEVRLVWLIDLFSQKVAGHLRRGPARVASPASNARGERQAQLAARHGPRKTAEPRPGGGAHARAHALAPSVPAEAPAGAVPRAVPAQAGSRSLCAVRAALQGPVAASPHLPVSKERCPGISAEKAAPSPCLPT